MEYISNHSNSLENSKRVILQTKNSNQKDEDIIIIDPTYQFFSDQNGNIQNQPDDSNYILEIEVLNSSSISIGTKIKIDQLGITEGSLRSEKDGVTYFGFLGNSGNLNEKEKNIKSENDSNDYIIPLKHCEKFGRFFKIQYIPKFKDYIIKDLGKGLGTFIKIQDYIFIRNSSMVNIGDSYLIFYFEKEENKTNEKKENGNTYGINKKLKVKLFDSKNNNDMKEFIFDNIPDKKINIGRVNHGNDIELNDNLSSKINCVIYYNTEKGWIIKDGNEVISKNGDIKRISSRNGTWLLANENIKIVDNLIFKSNFNIFRCKLIKS